jgi:glycosyltransferase involved in cell wall biosynthesis
VITLFDMSFWAVPDFTTDGIRLACQRGVLDALNNAAGLIFISEHARGEFNRFLPQFRRQKEIATVVTPLASRWPVVAQPASGMGRYWLYVGSQEPRKNISGLLDAYEGYLNEHANPLPLWLAGGVGWKNESWQPRLKRLEQRNLVRRLGYVADAAMPDLYQGATALVFPSWYEGFGLPVLEAMTQGCPVICSDRASMPEVGGEAVHYINPAATASITDAMVKLEGDRLYRSSLIERGLRQATKFSWKQTANLTLAFYEYVASNQAH